MSDERAFDENEVYDILRNERRRGVLRELAANGLASTIGRLADEIAAQEAGEAPPPTDVRQSVYVSLHQTHLPKLDNLGVVRYDRDDRTVELLPPGQEVVDHLKRDSDDDGRLVAVAAAALALAVVGLLLALGSLAGVPLLVSVAGVVWATVALVGVAVVSLVALLRPAAVPTDLVDRGT
jgi:hypothetical protein